uniref:aldehyde dehydrogenase family protein n=1 Tax=uncultured Herbaspirillum sp. TaxID=160236 RepID=UPI0025912111
MSDTLWHERAAAMPRDGRASIDGQRVAALSGATFDCISPIDGRKLAAVARCDTADIDRAVAAARQAFEDRRWAGLAPAARKRILIRFADLILQYRDELALLETLDMGKPIKYSRSVDVPAAANCIRWYGEAIDKLYDEIAPTGDASLALITREPVGVVAADRSALDADVAAFRKRTAIALGLLVAAWLAVLASQVRFGLRPLHRLGAQL